MPKEYRTIQEVAGPLMLVQGVEGVTFDELGEIELANGDMRRCKVLEVDGDNASCTAIRECYRYQPATVKYVSWVGVWSWVFLAICWAVSSMVWAVRSMMGRRSCRRRDEISTVCL